MEALARASSYDAVHHPVVPICGGIQCKISTGLLGARAKGWSNRDQTPVAKLCSHQDLIVHDPMRELSQSLNDEVKGRGQQLHNEWDHAVPMSM